MDFNAKYIKSFSRHQTPIDTKGFFYTMEDFVKEYNSPSPQFEYYYPGLIGYIAEAGIVMMWVEGEEGLIPGGYTYSENSDREIDFANKTYNFVPLNLDNVLDLYRRVDNEVHTISVSTSTISISNPDVKDVKVYLNGLRQALELDYTIDETSGTITFAEELQPNDIVIVDYKYRI